MTSFALKLIACITMLIDHFTYIFIPFGSLWWVGRGIGRIAFPIYCFLLVEGFYHTSNRKKYLLRLLIFALISEIPFDLAFNGFPGADTARLMNSQNVMWTLCIGFLLMMAYEGLKIKYPWNSPVFLLLGVLYILAFSGLAAILSTDYDFKGVLFILIFYLFRRKIIWIAVGLAVVIALFSIPLELAALFSLLFIVFYNGKEGRKVKYVFYLFYPVHLLILGIIGNIY